MNNRLSLDSKSLSDLVRKITSEAVNETLSPLRESERERQEMAAAEAEKLKGQSTSHSNQDLDEAEDDAESDDKRKVVSKKIATGKKEPEAPKAIIPDPSEIKDVTFSQVVNMMNMMRSGRSTKDPETKKSLRDYFDGLNPGERQTLFVLLSGLTQILAGGVGGEEAPDPAEVGIKIKPREAEKDTPPKVAGKKKAPSETQDSDAEPLPVVVGEVADRSSVRARVRKLRGSL